MIEMVSFVQYFLDYRENTFVETAKWLAKCEIAYYVECRKVIPIHHVEHFISVTHLAKFADKHVHIAENDVFLFTESLLTKCMRQGASLSGVCFIIGHGKGGGVGEVVNGTNMNRALVEVCMARSVTVDVIPGPRGIERQLIGRNPHDGPVNVVECLVRHG